MPERCISTHDLNTLTPAEVCCLWLNEDGYAWLLRERDRLITSLNDAPSNSELAISLINEVSLVTDVLDCYEQRKAALAEAA